MGLGDEKLHESQTRRVLRALFTKEANALENILKVETTSRATIVSKLALLTSRFGKLSEANEDTQTTLMSIPELADDILEAEFTKSGEYEERYLFIKDLVDQFIERTREDSFSRPPTVVEADPTQDVSLYLRHKFKPEISRKFDGDVGNWIGFWTQFKKIHLSDKWLEDEKFDILLKGLKHDSPAAKLLARFPPSAENYKKAVDLLESRYGREEYLIEFYVRKLLSLVLTRADGRTISELYDELEVQLNALDTLKVTKEKYAAMLFPLVESAVPEATFKVWERCRVAKDASMKEPADCLTELLTFLRMEVDGEERLKLRTHNFLERPQVTTPETSPAKSKPTTPTAASLLATGVRFEDKGCIFCDKSHPSQECAMAADMTLDKRNEIIKKKGACFKCLRKSGHLSSKCKLFIKCVLCKGRHYPLMCRGSEPSPGSEKVKEATKTLTTGGRVRGSPITFLQTMMAKIVIQDQETWVRVLCDSGSQKSYIVKACVKNLGLSRRSTFLIQQEVFGGSRTALSSHGVYSITLRAFDNSYENDFELLDQDQICSFVPKLYDVELYDELRKRGIVLSDFSEYPDENAYKEVQILLGADSWTKVMPSEHVEVRPGLLAINTKLGWTILGSTEDDKLTCASTLLTTLTCHTQLEHFWKLELLGIQDSATKISQEEKDRQVEEFFEDTVKVHQGRYTVSLPWIEGHDPLEDNWETACRRLESATKKLRDSDLFYEYDAIFQQWIELGIVEVVPESEISQYGHYLPHRAVIKEGSTTRVRPVFDASNRDRNSNSLNKSLEKGPNLIELIPMILINFRHGKIGISADIEKAFLQIALSQRDRDFVRFLWWRDGEILVMRHCRVVFGISSSPYLLGAVLKHALRNADPTKFKTVDRLKGSFYVDNCLTSLNSEDEVPSFIAESQQILAAVGFNLRGWVTNLKKPDQVEGVLGLKWYCNSDEIGLNIKPLLGVPEPLTRRVLLSLAQRIYDPIGFSAPISLVPKTLLQMSWSNQARWDDPLPGEICQDFRKWINEIPYLRDCKIPRRIITNLTSTMHIFCDASKMASAACVFIRTEHEGNVLVSLVMAKSHVAPPESVTIPRLELIAALIGSRLYKLVSPGFNIDSEKTFFWSDSSVVISWIKNTGPWNVFVTNRVREIRSHSDSSQWRHLPGCINPADLISRGCTPKQLVEEKWWEGPTWLYLDNKFWPSSEESPCLREVEREKRKTVISASATQVPPFTLTSLADRVSSFHRIVKVVMHVLDAICIICPSFINFCGLEDTMVLKRGFDSEKYLNAELTLIRHIQREYFNENVRKTVLKGFSSFTDDKGLIRIKSRILDDEHSEELSSPVILPGRHPLVMRMIEYQHLINNHAGVRTLLVILRDNFWLIRGRQAIGMVVKRCVDCQKIQALPLQVPTPPLPTDRTRPSTTYQITGVDLAGPLFLKDKGKAWIVIYTCAVYRAIHLELTQSLSTEAFIQALRRFIARRGRPKVIYSDNGTNFVGLDNLFHKIDWELMEKECSLQKIRWKFNPPTASWWGGFWERLIRVLKDILKKNLGQASLEQEDLTTLLCECEAIVNNRPLTYISENPDELKPLTPSMFIQSLVGNEVDDLDQIESSCLEKKWHYLQSIREGLKKRFSKEYLGMLRNAKPKRTDQLEVGDIVLVGSDNKRRLEWPLARVLELKPGRDGVSRLARLLTKNGEILRPLQRIYPLEINSVPMDSGDVQEKDATENGIEPPDSILELPDREDDDALQDLETLTEEKEMQETTRSGRLVKPRKILDL